MGIFSRINKGLKKTRENMSGAIDSMLHGKTEIDDEFYDELEEILVMGDVGCMTASEIVEQLRERVMKKHLRKPEAVKNEIKEIVAEMLEGGEEMSLITLPSVILVIGVNGVGKTTSKDMAAAVLSQKFRVLKTDGNFNNNIGVPKTLFRLSHEHQVAVATVV